MKEFNKKLYTYTIPDETLEQITSPIITFLESSPEIRIDDLPSFSGSGVYALFLKEPEHTFYSNCIPNDYPIYVGKAVSSGSRQGRSISKSNSLCSRLKKHKRSITQSMNLKTAWFSCKLVILEDGATNFISTIESYLIRHYNPLWNSYIDGFGNNDPGAGRLNQSPSEWDTLHEGRKFALKLKGTPPDLETIKSKIQNYVPKEIKTNDDID